MDNDNISLVFDMQTFTKVHTYYPLICINNTYELIESRESIQNKSLRIMTVKFNVLR